MVAWFVLNCARGSPASAVALNANRHVTGTLRGFDQFMNLVLDNTVDDKTKSDIGMVVRPTPAHLRHSCLPLCECVSVSVIKR